MQDSLSDLLRAALFLYMTAAFANMAPVVLWRTSWLPKLRVPLDGGLKIKGKPLLGTHKTWFGLVAAVIGGVTGVVAALAVEMLLGNSLVYDSLLKVSDLLLYMFWGALIGFGAIMGDAVKSIIKRRLDIKPGKPFIPWDQIDFVAGAWLAHQLVLPLYKDLQFFWMPKLSWEVLLAGVILVPALHLLANVIAYWLKWKKVWW